MPAAIAAPTPVSALVHSSTLVTAGVYLRIRLWGVLGGLNLNLILSLGTITMIMAGVSAISETDVKKIVALSTLRQLGLMFSSLGIGLVSICFRHLILHAFIKALLFIGIGIVIHSSGDYQHIKVAGVNSRLFPMKSAMVTVSNLGLRGFPFLAGFFSKDL